jgi:hypothetical protein
VGFVTTGNRLWKRLTPAERLEASTYFWQEPGAELEVTAIVTLARARNMRAQTTRGLTVEQKVKALAQVLDPGETLAGGLVVALHLGARRALLAAFLDLLKIPNEEGLLKEEAASLPPPTADEARAAVVELAGRFPVHEVEVYLNALWLQDPERWGVLEASSEWLSAAVPPTR